MIGLERRERVLLGVLTLTSVGVQIPFLGRGLSRLDEGSILAIADALNRGDLLYRDRATFIGPVIYEGVAALQSLFGAHVMVGRLFQALVFTACSLLVYRVVREFASPVWSFAAALAFLAVKALAFPLWTIPNYSQWATLETLVAVLGGLRFLATRKVAWLVLAGFAVGLAGVTKQTGAGIVGVALAVTIALDALLDGENALHARMMQIASRGGVLFLAALPPILFFAGYYALSGALPDAIDRAVVGLASYSSALGVPLPDLAVWSTDPAVLGPKSFIYFPTAVLALAWQGGLNLYSTGMALVVEFAVKLAYYGPWCVAAAGVFALRGLATATPLPSLRILLVLLLAVLAYWSASFRADWTHLMSVATELIVLTAVVLHHFSARLRVLPAISVLLCLAWLIGGAWVGIAAVKAYATPVQTARGELWVTPDEAAATTAVVAYANDRPATTRMAFLPTQPLFYALTDRPIASPFDLLIPAYFRDGDDAKLMSALEEVDEIVYDPNGMPTIAASLSEFAPESALQLARSFYFDRALAPTAYVLVRLGDAEERALHARADIDFFSADLGDSLPERVERAHWVMYRVMAVSLRKKDPGACFGFSHHVEAGQTLSFVPMLPPRSWGEAPAEASLRRGRFSVLLQEDRGPRQTLFAEVREAGAAVKAVHLSLEAFVGRNVALNFCASRLASDRPVAGVLGWGELRILRSSGATS